MLLLAAGRAAANEPKEWLLPLAKLPLLLEPAAPPAFNNLGEEAARGPAFTDAAVFVEVDVVVAAAAVPDSTLSRLALRSTTTRARGRGRCGGVR